MNEETKDALLRALGYVDWAKTAGASASEVLGLLSREIADPHECEDWALPEGECDYCCQPIKEAK